jgi:glycosyltransferase involved in cell wall biosynthesis
MENNQPSESRTVALAALIPAWNPGEALTATLNSLAVQPVECEIFVVDDGSDPAIELPESIGGKPIHLIRLEHNQGITAALNTGLKLILERPFEFIARHDCGDIDHIDRLKLQLDYIRQHEDVMLVGSAVNFNTPNGRLQYTFNAPRTQAQIERKMRYSAAIVHSSCMFRASVFAKIGLYSDRYPHAEDYDLFFRLLANHEIRNLPDILVTASYSKGSISMSNRQASLMSRLKLQLKYFNPFTIHSYFGVFQTVGLCMVPYRIVSLFKSAPSPFGQK